MNAEQALQGFTTPHPSFFVDLESRFFAPHILCWMSEPPAARLLCDAFPGRIAAVSPIGSARRRRRPLNRRRGERSPGSAATHDDTAATVRGFATGIEVIALPWLLPRALDQPVIAALAKSDVSRLILFVGVQRLFAGSSEPSRHIDVGESLEA